MKKLNHVFFMALMAAGLFACSNEEDPIVDNGLQSADNVYVTFNLSYPESRSETDDNGNEPGKSPSNADPEVEVGTVVENKITDVQLVFKDGKNNVVVSNPTIVDKTSGNPANQYTVTFQSGRLEKMVDTSVKAYVLCNIGAKGLSEDIEKAIRTGNIPDIYADNHFLMSNAKKATGYTFTSQQLKDAVDKTSPIDITGDNPIKVERAAARFDYKAKLAGNKYNVPLRKTDGSLDLNVEQTKPSEFNIVLTDMALTNESNKFYYLRRVKGDLDPTGAVIGGLEKKNMYVVDADWAAKKTLMGGGTYQTYLDGQNLVNNIEVFHKNKDVDYFEMLPSTTDAYTKVTYSSENTIPGTAGAALKGMATCVIFKGKIVLPEGGKFSEAYKASLQTYPTQTNLYVFKNTVYGTWTMVKAAAEKEGNPELTAAYNDAVAKATEVAGPEGTPVMTAAIAKEYGFTVYDQVDGNYPVYYYYWNEHNKVLEEGKPNPETIMYYSVVRNNVYKLMVNKILQYGHPHNPDGDPDPIIPTDPIIEKEYYFSVSIDVADWTVRQNDIEF